jgi:hypothetical protein
LDKIAAISVPYCKCFGIVAGGVMMARCAVKADEKLSNGGDEDFYAEKINTANFYNTHILSLAQGYAQTVIHGAENVIKAVF